VQAQKAELEASKLALALTLQQEQRQRACQDAVAHYDTKDFCQGVVGATKAKASRWDAFRRVMLLADTLSPERTRSIAHDWQKWDTCEHDRYPLASMGAVGDYANRYMKIIQKLAAILHAGHPGRIADWWEKQVAEKVAPAALVLPALPRPS
jgi:hypothetical protein